MQIDPATVYLAINSGGLVVLLAVLVLLLAASGAFAYFLVYCERLFKRIYSRPKPLPQIDRAPTKIDRTTITGRGRNWFYSFRREWINVRTGSFDGTKLSAYYRPSTEPGCPNIVIMLHGYDEEPTQCAAYAKLMMKKIKCHVLITHLRGHGMSGGKNFTWGLMESVDLDAWFEFTKRRLGNNCRIYLVGRGAGATACLLAAQQKGFDECVCGIIADSPMSSLTGFLKATLPQTTKINPDWISGQIRRNAQHKYKFDINPCDCSLHASAIKVPVLIFQGGEDDITPPSEWSS